MMARKSASLLLSALVLGLSACGSSTELGNLSLVGRWDGVGALQTSQDGAGITVYIESHSGSTFTGSWRRSQAYLEQGSLTATSFQDGSISFRLAGFPGTDPTFDGHLTDALRMAGTLSPVSLSGEAVFRRGRLSP